MKKLLSVLAVGVLIFTSCSNPANTQDSASHTEHTYGDWETVKAPTCTEKGQKKRKCTGCDKEETAEIDAKGHSFAAEWETDKDNHWHKATCGHDTEKSALGAHADSDSDGKCDACSFDMAADWAEQKFVFSADFLPTEVAHGKDALPKPNTNGNTMIPVITPKIETNSDGKKYLFFSDVGDNEGDGWEWRSADNPFANSDTDKYIRLIDPEIGDGYSYISYNELKALCEMNGLAMGALDFITLNNQIEALLPSAE